MNSNLALFSTLLAFVICVGCNVSSSNRYGSSDRPPAEPGKCYAKCLMPAFQGVDTLTYLPIYTGSRAESVQMSEFVVQEGSVSKKWEKIKSDGCQGSKDDCFVWCEKMVRTDRIVVNYVADTLVTKEYAMQPVVKQIVNGEGETAWKEVICQNDIRKDTYPTIAGALRDRGYLSNEHLLKANGQFDKQVKLALRNFQEDNNLPVGQLDIETLDALGYAY